jgi:peroxiredoxin Q/BCP
LRDNVKTFEDKNVVILGISGDSTETHKKWCEKIKLPFDLLADTDKAARKAYGFEGNARALFLIDKKGMIVFANRKYDLKPESFKALTDAVAALEK